MGREIKFRAWNIPNKLMYQNAQDGLLAENEKGQLVLGVSLGKLSKDAGSIIMQFTGLLDKNGKEIYESDIVRWDDMSDGKKWRVAKVEINPDIQFKIIRINSNLVQSAQEGYVFRYGNFTYKDTKNHLEIIGNIYENPELLNQ